VVENRTGRNRSQGWSHAKKSGHQNEQDFGKQLLEDQAFLDRLELKKFGQTSNSSPEILVDGAKKVTSIFGDQTTSKIDLGIAWSEHATIGVSVKKSSAGQVWLVSLERFLNCLEHYTGERISKNAELALALFIGGSNLNPIRERYEGALTTDSTVRPKLFVQELNQKRLVAASIQDNFSGAWEELMGLLTMNIEIITHLSFARGLANFKEDWADFVIYNLESDAEQTFGISDLAQGSAKSLKESPIVAGPRNGGSTIILPTGFLQMHHPQGENLLQFHHSYKKIQALQKG
jgi:hypothetical protein